MRPASRSAGLALELVLLAGLVAALAGLARWVAAPYRITSEAVIDALEPGDLVVLEKWRGRIGHALPARGAVVLFRTADAAARAGRVVALPGERVAAADGTLRIADRAVPTWRVADLIVPITAITPCRAGLGGVADAVDTLCRYQRHRLLLPGDTILELPGTRRTRLAGLDPVTVAPADVLVATDDGFRMVPARAVLGRAGPILFSADGSARAGDPASWKRAIRWDRIGMRP